MIDQVRTSLLFSRHHLFEIAVVRKYLPATVMMDGWPSG